MPDDSAPVVSETESSGPRRPSVVARYSSDYRPPFDVASVVERMVDSVPPKFLVGLSEIVLTDRGGLPRKRRRSVTYSRKKKVRILQARGMYHPAWKGKRAWIEIFVDATLRPLGEGILSNIPLVRNWELEDVLFHEIGHHIHYTVRPEYREKEDVADVWKVRLGRNYRRHRSGFTKLSIRLLRFFAGPIIDWLNFKVAKLRRNKGWMSQAEFEESTRATHRN